MFINVQNLQQNSIYPNAGYLDQFGPSLKFVENSIKLTCVEISFYPIQYSTALWLLELPIRRGRQVQTQVHTVHSNSENLELPMQHIFKEKFNYPDFLHIRISGVLLYLNSTERNVNFECTFSGYSEKLFQMVFVASSSRYKSIKYRFPCCVCTNSCSLSLPVVW